MTATARLTVDLQRQVKLLAADLLVRVDQDPTLRERWERDYKNAKQKDRTARSWTEWSEDRIDQTAVAWVLTSVFVRFCEDNQLVNPVWITGPGDRHQEALDAHLAFFRQPEHAEDSDREWLLEAFAYLGRLPATKSLVDAHSALRYASPSGKAIENLLKFWRDRDDNGVPVHDLHDETLSTRFLGDLYQDLSAHAKATYALLQTPVFVEEHILDRTLEPALNERPLDGFRMIDPTCGSGHFLLGAFDRLLDRWHRHAPGMETQARVQVALDAIHGVDLNPFAIAIARFRLMVAALQACGLTSLEDAPALNFHLVVGDSLIHGPEKGTLQGMESRSAFMQHYYPTEDASLLLQILEEGSYDVVVGNPPYITVKDKALDKVYRSKFDNICKGTYALTVPFMAQFFALAKEGDQSGWVGIITSNSFMKREFGAPFLEGFLPTKDLRLVEDTSGAYIPGHGTPTVIIIGRNQRPTSTVIRVVLSVRGEPSKPDFPAQALVWTSIAAHVDDVGWSDEWISVEDLDRGLLATHPWTLRGGGAIQLLESLNSHKKSIKHAIAGNVGFASFPGADDAFFASRQSFIRSRVPAMSIRALVTGVVVRDWAIRDDLWAITPYNAEADIVTLDQNSHRRQWPYRTTLGAITGFSGETKADTDQPWWGWYRWVPSRYKTPLSITFAEVETHNNFVLDRGGKVFKQTAPVIKLPAGSTEEAHFEILGVLNSSTACFWLKQCCQDKPSNGVKRGHESERWTVHYQFNGTNVQNFPLPDQLSFERARMLDSLARKLSGCEPSVVVASDIPSQEALDSARKESEEFRARMIAVQEELDWEVYHLYGIIDDDLTYRANNLPGLTLGERAFEISLAQSGEETEWFRRHGSTLSPEIPSCWSDAYQQLVRRRLKLIAEHPFVRLLERPEYKRRWLLDSWDKKQDKALRNWLLDRLEDKQLWFDANGTATPKSVGQLADEVTRDADMVSVLALWEGRPDVPITDSLERLLADEAVPFLAAYRYKDSGLRKRQAWEQTWDLQRREDRGEDVGPVPVPPKYVSADFRKPSYWRARGKLDVPKERFILYPHTSRDGDPTPLLGWAGWDHAEQALALAQIIGEREQEDWDDKRLVPLVAGLAELQPWVEQWHSDVHPKFGVSLAAFCEEQLDQQARQVGKTREELAAWRSAPRGRGRKKDGDG